MLIDWEEAERIALEHRARWQASKAAGEQLAGALGAIGRRGAGAGATFDGYIPQAVNVEAARAEQRRLKVGRLFDNPKVRELIGRELTRLDNSKRGGFAASIADELCDLDPEAARKLRVCADPNQMAFGVHVHDDESGDGSVMVKVERRRCWLRICPKCAKDHAARLRLRYEGRILKVVSTGAPGCRLKLLVLTLPRGSDLALDLVKLHRCTKRLVKHFWGVKGQGAFATAEVGPAGGNVHAHVVVYGAYVAQAEISDYWRELTGNASIVWVQACTPSKAVREGIKYISKLAKRDSAGNFTMTPAALAELHLALKGRRRVWCWGAFYGLADDDRDQAPADVGDQIEPRCRCGDPMVFFTTFEARIWLHLKGANNWTVQQPLSASGPPATAPP